MRRGFLIFVLILVFSFIASVTTEAAYPMFLLGQDGTVEVQTFNGKEVMKVSSFPEGVITGNKGQKIILVRGKVKKSGQLEAKAGLWLLAPDYKSIAKSIEFDSAMDCFQLSKDHDVIWLSTVGGRVGKEKITPKLYRVDLETLTVVEQNLDTTACAISLSNNETMIAVATLGGEASGSELSVYDTDTLQEKARIGIFKNPGLIEFSSNDQTLLVASYGWNTGLQLPEETYFKAKKPIPGGFTVINTTDWKQVQTQEFGLLSGPFCFGESGLFYAVTGEGKDKGKVIAFCTAGKMGEVSLYFVPLMVQEQPGSQQIFALGKNEIAIIKSTGYQIRRTIKTDYETRPLVFDEEYAYIHHVSSGKMSLINLNQLTLEKEVTVGRTGRAIFKGVLAVATIADNLASVNSSTRSSARPHVNWDWLKYPVGNTVFIPESRKLYMLNSLTNDVTVYDTAQNKEIKKITDVPEKAVYLQLTPNKKYIVLATENYWWKIIDTASDKVVLSLPVTGLLEIDMVKIPYYNPEGNMLYISTRSKVIVVDLKTGNRLEDITTKAKEPVVTW